MIVETCDGPFLYSFMWVHNAEVSNMKHRRVSSILIRRRESENPIWIFGIHKSYSFIIHFTVINYFKFFHLKLKINNTWWKLTLQCTMNEHDLWISKILSPRVVNYCSKLLLHIDLGLGMGNISALISLKWCISTN